MAQKIMIRKDRWTRRWGWFCDRRGHLTMGHDGYISHREALASAYEHLKVQHAPRRPDLTDPETWRFPRGSFADQAMRLALGEGYDRPRRNFDIPDYLP